MAGGCRDCSRCTERGAVGLAMMIPRIFTAIFVNWWLNLFRKKCPQCGHPMAWHERIGGRLAD
jgi:hypothetical protein